MFNLSFIIYNLGGESITISGSGFGGAASSADAIKVNGKATTITSYSASSVIVTLPANAPGTYSIDFSIGADGYAAVAANVVLVFWKYIFDIKLVSHIQKIKV